MQSYKTLTAQFYFVHTIQRMTKGYDKAKLKLLQPFLNQIISKVSKINSF